MLCLKLKKNRFGGILGVYCCVDVGIFIGFGCREWKNII